MMRKNNKNEMRQLVLIKIISVLFLNSPQLLAKSFKANL